eukprot:RCo005229
MDFEDGVLSFNNIPETQAKVPPSKKCLEFLNTFAATHQLKNLPDEGDFCPVKTVAMVVDALKVTRRSTDLFLLRLRRFVHRSLQLSAWIRRWLRARDCAVTKVINVWEQREGVQRKVVQQRIYKDFTLHADAAKSRIKTYVQLHTSDEYKVELVWSLYWERRAEFRRQFHRWYITFHGVDLEYAAAVTQLRAEPENSLAAEALLHKLEFLRRELEKLAPLQPRFSFPSNSAVIAELMARVRKTHAPPKLPALPRRANPLSLSPTGDVVYPGPGSPSSPTRAAFTRPVLSPEPGNVEARPLAALESSTRFSAANNRPSSPNYRPSAANNRPSSPGYLRPSSPPRQLSAAARPGTSSSTTSPTTPGPPGKPLAVAAAAGAGNGVAVPPPRAVPLPLKPSGSGGSPDLAPKEPRASEDPPMGLLAAPVLGARPATSSGILSATSPPLRALAVPTL